jgi:hypothetical protein
MNSYRFTLLSTLSICLNLATAFAADAAQAGPVYVYLVVDPSTTAGAGVPASGGFAVTSTRSGVGTWHLYAVDDIIGSFGIRNYSVTLPAQFRHSVTAHR